MASVGVRILWVARLPLLTNWFAYGVFAPHFSIINTDASPVTKYAVSSISIAPALLIIGELASIAQRRFAKPAQLADGSFIAGPMQMIDSKESGM
ncbi:MAG TPA: hypothetical protein VFA63_07575 [Pseudonocardiaceae bacterium]|nr:hypothetical protein [Pseudonocardiaceae bacterium]